MDTKAITRREKSHAKNLENLSKLIAFLVSWGAKYNPSNKDIKLAALQALLTAAGAAQDEIAVQLAPYSQAVDAREALYENLGKLVTRILKAMSAEGVSAALIADADTFKRKIHGTFADTAPKDNPATPDVDESKVNRAVQTGYAALLENFKSLVELLKTIPEYKPNKPELQVAALETLVSQMEAANKAVDETYPPLSNARAARNAVFYADEKNAYELFKLVKNYVYSDFGGDSAEYKQIKNLAFTKPDGY